MSSKKALLCVALIPCMSLPIPEVIRNAWNNTVPATTQTAITAGLNDGVKSLCSKAVVAAPLVIGIIIYKKWLYNKPSDTKRSRMVRESNCRMKEIKFLDSEITALEQKESLNDVEQKDLARMKETRMSLKCALLESQYLLIKPSKKASEGTLYEKATEFFSRLPN